MIDFMFDPEAFSQEWEELQELSREVSRYVSSADTFVESEIDFAWSQLDFDDIHNEDC